MKIEKKQPEKTKSILENNNFIDDQELATSELQNLHDKLDQYVKDLAEASKFKGSGSPDVETVNKINKLKYHRKAIKDAYKLACAISEPEWENRRAEIKLAFDKAEEVLENNPTD